MGFREKLSFAKVMAGQRPKSAQNSQNPWFIVVLGTHTMVYFTFEVTDGKPLIRPSWWYLVCSHRTPLRVANPWSTAQTVT